MGSISDFFCLLIPLIGVCLWSTLVVKYRGLQCIDEMEEASVSQLEEQQSVVSNCRSLETGGASNQRNEKIVEKEKTT